MLCYGSMYVGSYTHCWSDRYRSPYEAKGVYYDYLPALIKTFCM